MRRMYIVFLILIFISLLVKVTVYGANVKKNKSAQYENWQNVSIIQLIATPERFHNKFVLVIGFVNLKFEGDAVYLSEEHYKHGLTKDAVWLNLTEEIGKNKEQYNGKYCLIMGKFNAKRNGHMGAFSGEIGDIERFVVNER